MKRLFLTLTLWLLPIAALANDLNLATTPSSFVRFGRELADSQVSQSFQLGNANVTGVTIFLARRGTPTVPISVSLQKAGKELAKATISPSTAISSDPSSPTKVVTSFPSPASTSGDLLLVLTAPNTQTSGSNHYYLALGRASPDPGVFTFKGNPMSVDLVGSIQHQPEEAPPAPPPPPPLDFVCEGYGCTEGGNNGTIYHVTNLNDSGPGSLRDAVSQGNRRVVFDLAGEIRLDHMIEIKPANITLDGFTAPSPGITLVGGAAGIAIHGPFSPYIRGSTGKDIIVRGLRVRDAHGDCIQIGWGATKIVVDHVSVDNCGDGDVDITTGSHDITVQWSIIGRSEKAMLLKPVTGAGSTPDTERFSIHHNALIGSGGRNPRISNGHSNTGKKGDDVHTDFVNNIVAEWASGIGTDVECGAQANIVNNFYSNPRRPDVAIIIRGPGGSAGFASCNDAQGNPIGGFAHVKGNVSADNVKRDINSNPEWITSNQAEPFFVPNEAQVATTDACTARRDVLDGAGMFPRDSVDELLVGMVNPGPCR